MKNWKIAAIVLLSLVLAGSVACIPFRSGGEASVPEYQTATVGRGDITVDITAAGNRSSALEEDLAFETAGYVEEVLVEEGDEVSQGQVLATLDTSDLEDAVTEAERAVENAKVAVLQTQASQLQAEASLEQEEEDLKNLKRQNIHGYRRTIAELNLEAAELNLEAAELRLEIANSNLVSAEEDLVEAQEELDGAVIIAPFDGFVTSVDVEGGDEVYKGTVAVRVVDPQRFKAEILVGEMDIFEIKLGGEALVEVDSQPMLSIPAEVTYISPTATIQSGVVNYEVEVELEPLETLKQQMLETMQEKQGETQGEPQNPMLTMLEGFQLKEGLNITVSILISQASDVLLVPNQAITYQGMRAYVQVLKDGDNEEQITEERSIQTGINDWQYTEVISGLSEGEEVVVPEATTTPAMSEGRMGGGSPPGMMFPH